MRLLLVLSTGLWACVSMVSAQKVGLKSTVGYGCWSCAFQWNFTCPHELGHFECRCHNENFLGTALNCIHVYAPGKEEINWGYDYVRSQCHFWGNRTMTNKELDAIYKRTSKDLVEPDSVTQEDVLIRPVAVPQQLFDKEKLEATDAKTQYKMGTIFGCAIIAYWVLIIGGASLINFCNIYIPKVHTSFGHKSSNWFRKYVTLPALVGDQHHAPYKILWFFTIKAPTRGQAMIVFFFLVLNIISLTTCYDLGNLRRPFLSASTTDRLIRFIGNRTGIIAFTYLPTVMLFAMRNNPFILTTGWSYETFMLYHRWCARLMALMAVIHAILFTWSVVLEDLVHFKWTYVHNWRGGNMAMYFMIILLIFTVSGIRRRVYEVFLVVHRVLFVVIMACLVVHCSDFGWLGWLWATLGLYGIEMLMRVARMRHSGGIQDAVFSLAAADMYRVRITGPRRWVLYPGQYVYIRVFTQKLFWQAHPFSVFQAVSGRESNSLELCIKGKSGATRQIVDLLKASPKNQVTLKVLIEGPYGHNNRIETFDSILVLAGGVGVTAMYSYVDLMVSKLRAEQSMCLVWVVNTEDTLHAFDEELVRLMEVEHLLDIKIYLTQSKKNGTISVTTVSVCSTARSSLGSKIGASPSTTNLLQVPYGKSFFGESTDSVYTIYDDQQGQKHKSVDIPLNSVIRYGRPEVDTLTREFIRTSRGSKAILSCGPPKFVDNARDGIVKSIEQSDARVDYFEEAFSW